MGACASWLKRSMPGLEDPMCVRSCGVLSLRQARLCCRQEEAQQAVYWGNDREGTLAGKRCADTCASVQNGWLLPGLRR